MVWIPVFYLGAKSKRSRAKGLLCGANFEGRAESDQPLVQKKDLPCYFWRKSNQNVGVGCAIEEAGSCQTLPHKSCWKIL